MTLRQSVKQIQRPVFSAPHNTPLNTFSEKYIKDPNIPRILRKAIAEIQIARNCKSDNSTFIGGNHNDPNIRRILGKAVIEICNGFKSRAIPPLLNFLATVFRVEKWEDEELQAWQDKGSQYYTETHETRKVLAEVKVILRGVEAQVAEMQSYDKYTRRTKLRSIPEEKEVTEGLYM